MHYKSTGSPKRERRHVCRKKSRNPVNEVLVKNKGSLRELQGVSILLYYHIITDLATDLKKFRKIIPRKLPHRDGQIHRMLPEARLRLQP